MNQPLAAVVTNAAACLRWLDREPANLKEARGTVQSIIKDGNRAGEVIQRVRALANKTADRKAPRHINEVVNEVISLVQRRSCSASRVALRLELAPPSPGPRRPGPVCSKSSSTSSINTIEAMQAGQGPAARTGDPNAHRMRPHRFWSR